MPRQVVSKTNDQRLQSLLGALESELLQASDEEIRLAAGDLGIDPDMKGSIAWLGIFYPSKVKLDEVFDLEAMRSRLLRRLKGPGRPK